MRRARPLLLSALLALAACANYALAPANQPRAVAGSTLTITPSIAWNRLDSRSLGKHVELWTLDGPGLNTLTCYGGVADGQPLFRESDKRDRPLPRFAATMLLPDIAALFESSYRVALGTSLFHLGTLEPATFAGAPGFRFTFDFTLQDEEVRRQGEATGAVIGGRLYLVTFEAPALHYFARNLADVRTVVASARIATATR